MTIVDAGTLPAGAILRPELLVIGSGPAGMTTVLDLLGQGRSMVMLESGQREPDEASQELLDGDRVGQPFLYGGYPISLRDVRRRGLGGSTWHWGGMTRPLDELDFLDRPEVGRSGWPIRQSDLEPWYRRAAATIQVAPSDGTTRELEADRESWLRQREVANPFETERMTTALFRLSPPTIFGRMYGPALESDPDCMVVIGATALQIETTTDGRRVTAVEAVDPHGRPIRVEAEIVVLATGGIDVPRLLLASRRASTSGVANSTGLVGLGFMEHSVVPLGQAVLRVDPAVHDVLDQHVGAGPDSGNRGWLALRLRSDVLREHALLNAAVTFWPSSPAVRSAPELDAGVAALLGVGGDERAERHAVIIAEQLPLSSRRVSLGARQDRFGVAVASVQWEFDGVDLDSVRRSARLFAEELARSGLGRMEVGPGGPVVKTSAQIGCHHMGTTRMSANPTTGVVDENLRAHDVDNLYIAGSAVFPSSGFANPTLTIVALSHRLAAHLAN